MDVGQPGPARAEARHLVPVPGLAGDPARRRAGQRTSVLQRPPTMFAAGEFLPGLGSPPPGPGSEPGLPLAGQRAGNEPTARGWPA
ncbi:MAG: hypothetical protein ACLQB1_24305 [Streptosporangiaceae bacterium]